MIIGIIRPVLNSKSNEYSNKRLRHSFIQSETKVFSFFPIHLFSIFFLSLYEADGLYKIVYGNIGYGIVIISQLTDIFSVYSLSKLCAVPENNLSAASVRA